MNPLTKYMILPRKVSCYAKRVLAILFVGLSLTSYTQTVDELIDMAKTNNPGLKALRSDYEAARQKENQVQDWPDPTFNLGVSILPVETRLGAQQAKLGITQMIPWKGSLSAQADVSRANAEILKNTDAVQEIDIELAIRNAYSSLQLLDQQVAIIEARIEVTDVLLELSKSAVRSGKGKLSNVLLTERKKEILLADQLLLIKKKEQATILINRWTGRSLETIIELKVPKQTAQTKDDFMQYASTNHPQLTIIEDKIKASQARADYTKYASKPKIGVGLEYALITPRNDVEIPNNGRDILMPMGSISIPLHTKRYDAIRQEESIKQQAYQWQQEEFQDMFFAEIEMASSNIEYQFQRIQKFQSLKNITIETLQLMRQEYAAEGTRFEELLRLEMELIDYDQDIFEAQYEINLAQATLLKYQ